jgi:hypothetical protein
MLEIAEGRDGWLFLKRDGNRHVLQEACDLHEWRATILPRVVASMRARAARLHALGLPLILLLTPECRSIYPEYLPPGIVLAEPCAAELAAAAFRQAGLTVVCPIEALRQAKGAAELFLRTDTHWTHQGAFIAYQHLMRHIPEVPALSAQEVSFGARQGFGDLGIFMRPERRGTLTTATVPGRAPVRLRELNDQHLHSFRHTCCPHGTGRLLMFRDSAANALMPFLDATFAETVMIAPSPALPDDAITPWSPDVVVIQLSEVALFERAQPFADWQARGFAERHLTEPAGEPLDGLRAEALAALQAGDGGRALAPAAAAAVLANTTDDAGVLAWAMLNAGQHRACAALTAGLATQRDDAFLHYLHAQAAVNLAETHTARAALERALALRPGHALFLYSLAEMEYKAGHFSAALAAAQLSLRSEPLHPRSWEIAIDSLRRLGDDISADQLQAEAPP